VVSALKRSYRDIIIGDRHDVALVQVDSIIAIQYSLALEPAHGLRPSTGLNPSLTHAAGEDNTISVWLGCQRA
jgi:hypothetical protein